MGVPESNFNDFQKKLISIKKSRPFLASSYMKVDPVKKR